MAYTELHTAALRLVHVTRPSDRDMDYLTREFHLTPADTEAILGVAEHNTIAQTDTYRRLTIQWPTPTRRGIVLTDVHCLVGAGWIAVVDHGNFPAALELIQELQNVPAERLWQDGPMMMLYELWRRAIRDLQNFDHALGSAQLVSFVRARSAVGETLKHFAESSPATTDHDDVVRGFSFLAFTLSHVNPAGARAPVMATSKLPITVRGYAAVSTAVVVLTLIVVSRTL